MARRKPRNWKKDQKQDNFQDASMAREYDKGKLAGEQSASASDKGVYPVKTGSRDNDPSWYIPNGQIAADVASLPTVIRNGSPINNNSTASLTSQSSSVTYVPGVMVLYTIPMFGSAEDNYSQLNVASTAFWQELRRAKSGRIYYEKNNSMMYLIAVGNLYSFYSFVTRLYGFMGEFSSLNAYTPKTIVKAMGVNFDDIDQNLANFRTWINQFAYKVQAIPAPNVTDYITRQIFMYESIYMDANSEKSQWYMYTPYGFYQYSEGTSTSAQGSLTLKPLPCFTKGVSQGMNQANLMSANDIMEYGNALYQAIITSQDMSQYIPTDILNAFGTNIYTLNPIAENFQTKPVYNAEVLSQFENAYIYGFEEAYAQLLQDNSLNNSHLYATTYFSPTNFGTEYDITGWDGVVSSPNYGMYLNRRQLDTIALNFHKPSFSPEDVLVATRMSGIPPRYLPGSSWTAPSGASYTACVVPRLCGSSIAMHGEIFYFETPTQVGLGRASHKAFASDWPINIPTGSGSELGVSIQHLADRFREMQMLSTFDWHPAVCNVILPKVSDLTTTAQIYASGMAFDLDNYTILSADLLKQINGAALLGEFTNKMPNFGK